MHHPIERITHTTAFVTPVVEHWLEREIAQWVHPMKDRSDDPSHHERTKKKRPTSKITNNSKHEPKSGQNFTKTEINYTLPGPYPDQNPGWGWGGEYLFL